MNDFTELDFSEPSPFICGENGHFGVTDGARHWTVIVTEEAMKATASPPEASVFRLKRYTFFYLDLVRSALAGNEESAGAVWIFEKDVRAGLSLSHYRNLTSAHAHTSNPW